MIFLSINFRIHDEKITKIFIELLFVVVHAGQNIALYTKFKSSRLHFRL